MLSIPDKNKVSKEEWETYILGIINHRPTDKERESYRLLNEKYNPEMFEIDEKNI